MEIRLATEQEISKLSQLSVRVGNIPFFPGQAKAALLLDKSEDGKEEEIVGFAAVQTAWHAAGSWVKEGLRRRGLTYQMRNELENGLRASGITVYCALPGTSFERELFAKYGHVIEQTVQIRHL